MYGERERDIYIKMYRYKALDYILLVRCIALDHIILDILLSRLPCSGPVEFRRLGRLCALSTRPACVERERYMHIEQ